MARHRDRVLIIISLIFFLIAGCIFGTIFLMQRASTSPRRTVTFRWRAQTPKEKQAMQDKAQYLRERWQVWAREHKDELRRMLAAKSTNTAALMRVYNAIPSSPHDVAPGFGPAWNSEPYGFSWNIGAERLVFPPKILADPQKKEHHEKAISYTAMIRDQKFAEYHDIPLGWSTNGGQFHYTVWASGRVTETILSERFKKDRFLEASERELSPPYDFLR